MCGRPFGWAGGAENQGGAETFAARVPFEGTSRALRHLPLLLHFIVLSPPNPAIHTPLPPVPRAETLAADRGRRGTGQHLKTTGFSGRNAITEGAAFQVCTTKGKANFTSLHEHTLDLHQYYHIYALINYQTRFALSNTIWMIFNVSTLVLLWHFFFLFWTQESFRQLTRALLPIHATARPLTTHVYISPFIYASIRPHSFCQKRQRRRNSTTPLHRCVAVWHKCEWGVFFPLKHILQPW